MRCHPESPHRYNRLRMVTAFRYWYCAMTMSCTSQFNRTPPFARCDRHSGPSSDLTTTATSRLPSSRTYAYCDPSGLILGFGGARRPRTRMSACDSLSGADTACSRLSHPSLTDAAPASCNGLATVNGHSLAADRSKKFGTTESPFICVWCSKNRPPQAYVRCPPGHFGATSVASSEAGHRPADSDAVNN